MYKMNEAFANCFIYDIAIPIKCEGLPNVCDCINAHTDKYRKGKVELETIYQPDFDYK